MRPEASASQASPLTVLVGSTTYVFSPGPDVMVGSGSQCHIRLDADGSGKTAPEGLVLRFADTRWVAIDSSGDGLVVDGVRVATVDIHDGLQITIGDPQQGPRLAFYVRPATPTPPPPPDPAPEPATPPVAAEPAAPDPPAPRHLPPTEQPTNRMRAIQLEPATESPTGPIPLPPMASPPAPPPEPPPAAPPEPPPATPPQTVAPGPPPPAQPEPRPTQPGSTFRLPLKSDARTDGVAAYRVGLTAGSVAGHDLLTNVSFAARPGTLTAIVGPSAARNSALLDVLSGVREPSSGKITVDGHDVHESTHTRIGIVPRDERVHPRLTVERALTYAAKLRLPPDTSADHRSRVVDQVVDELDLTPHRKTRIGKLPPEMRRCASMGIELISRPTLLVVDEPGAGLDAAQAYHVLTMLRRQADIGCVVVVAMSSIDLNLCDELLLLAPTGTLAFAGPPTQIVSAMGTTDWSEIFARLNSDPHGAYRAHLSRQPEPSAPPPAAAPLPPPAPLTLGQQIRFVAGRQVRLLLASHIYFPFLLMLPVALGALTALIPGNSGFARSTPPSPNVHEAIEILAVLNIAAVIIGSALTIRELVGERRIFRREQAIGLSTPAYLLGKLIVFGVAAAVLSAVLTAIVIALKGGPVHGAVLLHNADVELYVAVATTAVVSAIIGLAVSTLGNSLREVLLLLLPVILASLLFSGGLVPLVGTWGYDQVSWFVPAQWGFAASASTVDLHRVDPLAANAQMWTHYSGWWVFDMVVLVFFGVVWAAFVLYRLLPPQRETRTGRPGTGHGDAPISNPTR